MAKPEGSAWVGIGAVTGKELADNLSSIRILILEALVIVAAGGAILVAGQRLREIGVAESPFAFLRLLSVAQDPLPSLVAFLGYFMPLIAISLGFDAVNSEYNRRTLSRVLAQPLYRDALLLGKFLAGALTVALVLVSLWLFLTGMGIYVLGIPPSGEELARSLIYLLVTLLYAGVWLALGLALSILFRQPATSAMAALGAWILFTVLWPMLIQLVATAFKPVKFDTPAERLEQFELLLTLNRLSPNGLYSEAMEAVLQPETRTLGPVSREAMQAAIPGAPLPVAESLVLVWPHLVALSATVLVLFATSYLLFQRREIRA